MDPSWESTLVSENTNPNYPFTISWLLTINWFNQSHKIHVTGIFTDSFHYIPFPRHPIILSDDDWGVQSPPKPIVFRFHETILSFGEPSFPRDSQWIPFMGINERSVSWGFVDFVLRGSHFNELKQCLSVLRIYAWRPVIWGWPADGILATKKAATKRPKWGHPGANIMSYWVSYILYVGLTNLNSP